MSETKDVDALLAEITAVRVGMAVGPMAELLDLGEAAVAPTAAAFVRCKDEEDTDSLWLLVVLGELRSAAAIATLAPLLEVEGMPTEHALAAGEALAKIGAPAIPALIAASRSERRTERILAYGALGAIDDPAAQGALLDALGREREVADVVVAALAEHGGADVVPAVLEAYRGAPPHLRPQIEESLRDLHSPDGAPGLLDRPWQVRYRRRPRLGTFEPGWPGIAAIVHSDPATWADQPSAELRELDAILAEPGEETCECCGAAFQDPTGIPVCPKSAVRAVSVQMALLNQELEEGVEQLPDLLDEIEDRLWTIEARRVEREEGGDGAGEADGDAEARVSTDGSGHRHGPGCSHDHGDEDDERSEEEVALDEAEEELELLRATGEWLLETGAEDIEAGIELLRAKAAEFEALYGIDGNGPRRVKVGRNDACPCGSGKKFKKCCAP